MINEEIEKLKEIQQAILDYLDNNDKSVNESKDLILLLDNKNISKDPYLLKDFLCLISKISNNHHRNQLFWDKIDHIISHHQKEIKTSFSNTTIYYIFQKSKRILYFLFNSNILNLDENLFQILYLKYQYNPQKLMYFMKEIRQFLNYYSISSFEKQYPEICEYYSESFDLKRKIGENEDYICQLIRNDSIKEFVSYTTQNSISLQKRKIELSIFETNDFLTQFHEYSLIEYAAFYGSIQIFKYLYINDVELSPSLWLFAIHGRNSEIIHLLEEKHIEPEDVSYKKCMEESIKCHHNEIFNYIKDNLSKNAENDTNVYLMNLCHFNFINLSENSANDLSDSQILCHCCRFGCCSIVNQFIEDPRFNVNTQIIIEIKKKKRNDYEITTKKYKKRVVSPIHLAVKEKNIELTTILLRRNDLDINLKGKFFTREKRDGYEPSSEEEEDEETALSLAIREEDIKIIELLLKRDDIDINQMLISTKHNESEEDCCCYVGSALVKTKEDIKYQENAMHIAVMHRYYDIIKLLLTKKNVDLKSQYITEEQTWENWDGDGDVSMKSKDLKKTVIQLASEYCDTTIIQLLNNYQINK